MKNQIKLFILFAIFAFCHAITIETNIAFAEDLAITNVSGPSYLKDHIPAYSIDNDPTTYWEGDLLEFDMGTDVLLSGVSIAFLKGNLLEAQFEIQVSNDLVSWTSIFNGNSSGTTVEKEIFNLPETTSRYIRLTGLGTSVHGLNRITEVDFDGTIPEPVINSPVSFSLKQSSPQESLPDNSEPTTSIEQFGITWTFAEPVQAGQFVNGDYWVLDNGSGIKIISISPPSLDTLGRIQNGSMLNPTTSVNGYDNAMNSITYSPESNAARPNGKALSTENPLTIQGNNSLVSTITNTTPHTRPQLVDAAILTVVTSPPVKGSFRPPYSGTDKTQKWNFSDIQWQLLPALPKSSIAALPDITTLEAKIERVWLDHGGGAWTGREFHPSNNMPDYGRDMAIITGDIALTLLLNYDQSIINTLMIRFLQLGIDWYGVTENHTNIYKTTTQGGLWMGGGGHGQGRKWPMIFTGLMFNDSEILKYTNGMTYTIFQEEQQYFNISQSDVNLPRYTADKRTRVPYTSDMIGKAEWGEQHLNAPQRDGSNWDVTYREIVSMSLSGHTLAAILMDARMIWNWDSFFEYHDRWWEHRKTTGEPSSYSSFCEEMWTKYR